MRHPTRPVALALLAATLLPGLGLLQGCSLIDHSPVASTAKRYAIVIGVQDYPGTSADLSYTDNDADDIATALAARGWTITKRLIATNEGTIVTDGQPTLANITAAIGDLTTLIGTDTDASILVYYSGHGSVYQGTAYMVPYDGIDLSGTSVVSNWITPAEMTAMLGAVPAKNRVLILDSCDSGGFALSASAVDLSPVDYSVRGLTTSDKNAIMTGLANMGSLVSANLSSFGDPEVQVLAAAGLYEESYDGNGNGVFTLTLLDAFTKGDADGDGVLTLTEAYTYSRDYFKSMWETYFNTSTGLTMFNNLYGTSYTDWNQLIMDFGGLPDFLPRISGGTGDVALFTM